MLKLLCACVLSLAAGLALAQESAIGDETPTADQAKEKVETIATVDAKTDDEFKPPPGYKTKKRGKITLYCIKDSTVGTRFQTEKCYDEEQIRALLLAREQNNRDFDKSRATCSNPAICTAP